MAFRVKLVVEFSSAADDDLPPVREFLVGGVPAARGEAAGDFFPVAGGAREECSHSPFAVVEAAGLNQRSVGGDGGGGAPYVCLKEKRAEGVVGDVVFDGVGGAVCFDDLFVRVVAAAAAWEGEVGEAEVGAVENEDSVGVEELHVHGDNADAFLEKLPLAGGGGDDGRRRRECDGGEEESCEED